MGSNFSSLMKNQNNPLSHKCEAGVSLLERTVGLGIILSLEVAIVVYARFRINAFAEEPLNALC
jgi:hypothetical protein